MDSKNVSTKRLEKEKAASLTRTKAVSKEELLKNSKNKFYENLKNAYVSNKDSKELPPAPKAKPKQDIVKRNQETAASKKVVPKPPAKA
jgi:hypothetical protein